jgi:hypothetical protein
MVNVVLHRGSNPQFPFLAPALSSSCILQRPVAKLIVYVAMHTVGWQTRCRHIMVNRHATVVQAARNGLKVNRRTPKNKKLTHHNNAARMAHGAVSTQCAIQNFSAITFCAICCAKQKLIFSTLRQRQGRS